MMTAYTGSSLLHFIALGAAIAVVLAFFWELFRGVRKGVRRRRARRASREAPLRRSEQNPIIAPDRRRIWEMEGTFNPGAILGKDGRVHLFYRAIGADGISRIGHASSADGVHFSERTPYPVFQPMAGYGMPDPQKHIGPQRYDPTFYTSGGGWGGAEDPRAVMIDGRIYVTYVAFEGWEHMHMAVTSIDARDFDARRWNWRRPSLISKRRSKNWVLFPEKIHGKFAIVHGVLDRVMIEYVSSLDAVPDIKSLPNRDGMPGYHVPSRKGYWDEWVRGAGAPPVRTDRGWLLFYNVVSPQDPGKYKIGAMLLNLDDPSRIIYRSPMPLLEPTMQYETNGRPGIVYVSGAVIKDGSVFIYYGAGDRSIGVATARLDDLLNWLTGYGKV